MHIPGSTKKGSVSDHFRFELVSKFTGVRPTSPGTLNRDKNRGSYVSSECHLEWTARLVAAKELTLRQLKCRPVEHT